MTKAEVNQLAYEIVGCAIEVHKILGPGLLESIYEEALFLELTLRGYLIHRQVSVPVVYKNEELKTPLKLDLIVENAVIVELKAVKSLHDVHKAQILTYMKLTEIPKGLLINFNVLNIVKDGLVPFVNEFFEQLPD